MTEKTPSADITAAAAHLARVLLGFPYIKQAVLFGSVAAASATSASDLDIAVRADEPLSTEQRKALIGALALEFNRPIDVVDLASAGQPVLDKIVTSGMQVVGSSRLWGDLVYRNVLDQEDFVPYQDRILEGRRKAWINS